MQPSNTDSMEAGQSSDNHAAPAESLLAGVPISEKKGGAPSPTMWFGICAAVVVLIVIIIIVYMRNKSNSAPKSGFAAGSGDSAMATKLASCGWVLYTRDGCGYCTQQMQSLYGGYPREVHYSASGKLIKSAVPDPIPYEKVQGFPFWHNTMTGQSKAGYQDTVAINHMTKACPISQ
jgi:hypothetical protein